MMLCGIYGWNALYYVLLGYGELMKFRDALKHWLTMATLWNSQLKLHHILTIVEKQILHQVCLPMQGRSTSYFATTLWYCIFLLIEFEPIIADQSLSLN